MGSFLQSSISRRIIVIAAPYWIPDRIPVDVRADRMAEAAMADDLHGYLGTITSAERSQVLLLMLSCFQPHTLRHSRDLGPMAARAAITALTALLRADLARSGRHLHVVEDNPAAPDNISITVAGLSRRATS